MWLVGSRVKKKPKNVSGGWGIWTQVVETGGETEGYWKEKEWKGASPCYIHPSNTQGSLQILIHLIARTIKIF